MSDDITLATLEERTWMLEKTLEKSEENIRKGYVLAMRLLCSDMELDDEEQSSMEYFIREGKWRLEDGIW